MNTLSHGNCVLGGDVRFRPITTGVMRPKSVIQIHRQKKRLRSFARGAMWRGRRAAIDAAPADVKANDDHRLPDEHRRSMSRA